jgi:hypothetical protein
MRARHWLIPAGFLFASTPACSEDPDDSFGSAGKGNASGSGGAQATGGSAAGATGGSSGSGAEAGSTSSGGTSGSAAGGSAGAPGGASAGGGSPVTCTITPTASVSTAIATVGVVTFTTDLAELTEASVEFGLTTDYGMSAPVSLTQANYRALLLGMKASRTYHYRVVARAGQSVCTSADAALMTGALPNALPVITRVPATGTGLAGGFVVGSLQQAGYLFMLDADGDYVWAFAATSISRAQMSYSGQHVWFLTSNQGGGAPNVRRVAIDGTGIEMHTEFGDAHHDLVVLPDESVGFFQYTGGRDRLMERAPDGTVRQIVDVPTAHGGVTNNHSNSIQYFAPDDAYTFSDLDQNCYVKVSRQGEVAWVLGGSTSDFTGAGATWTREHGHHLLAPNRLLFFNNGSQGTDSIMREVTLDLSAMTATTSWMYDGDESSQTLGDVQRLSNGNTLVTYSNAGVIHEVDAGGTLLQSLSIASGSFGYVMKRASLYGAPPKQGGI